MFIKLVDRARPPQRQNRNEVTVLYLVTWVASVNERLLFKFLASSLLLMTMSVSVGERLVCATHRRMERSDRPHTPTGPV